jgi:HAE1 family hydrophobic/amphiphilic exporter-1
VATPLEQQINGVDNMIYMKSINANDGTMTIQVSFEVGTDPDMNTVFTQNRVAAATAKLPEEVKRLGVTTEKSMPNILMLITLTRKTPASISSFWATIRPDQHQGHPGPHQGHRPGERAGCQRLLHAHLDQARPPGPPGHHRARDHGRHPGPERHRSGRQVRRRAGPAGHRVHLHGAPARPPAECRGVRRNRRRTAENGSQVKIKHIARVELGVETYNAFTRMNGKQCAMIALYQAPGSNAVALAEQVKATMADLSRSFPKSMRYDISLDTTTAITAGIDEIIETLFIALALVILVVFIFIQDWRATLIPTIAIPVSLLATFMAFPMIGFTINVLSLLGLVLAIGIVVDDAIVVVEAVQVKIEEGMTPRRPPRPP